MYKHLPLFAGIIIFVILTSCTSYNSKYYQLYELESDNVKINNEKFLFENADLSITYNFWSLYGSSTITVFNKTDEDLIVDLANSHLIINDFAITYYQGRTYSSSKTASTGVAAQGGNSLLTAFTNGLLKDENRSVQRYEDYQSGSTVSSTESNEIIIPKMSYKIVSGLMINSALFRHCDLLLFPKKSGNNSWNDYSKKETIPPPSNSTVAFNINNSPYKIRNVVAYSTLSNKKAVVENTFWVKSISNIVFADFESEVIDEFCGQKFKKTVFNYYGSNKFYISYPYNSYYSSSVH